MWRAHHWATARSRRLRVDIKGERLSGVITTYFPPFWTKNIFWKYRISTKIWIFGSCDTVFYSTSILEICSLLWPSHNASSTWSQDLQHKSGPLQDTCPLCSTGAMKFSTWDPQMCFRESEREREFTCHKYQSFKCLVQWFLINWYSCTTITQPKF